MDEGGFFVLLPFLRLVIIYVTIIKNDLGNFLTCMRIGIGGKYDII